MGIKLGDKACWSAARLREHCWNARVPVSPWEGRANLFRCQAGRDPGTGAVLLSDDDLAALDTTGDLDLTFEDDVAKSVLKRLTVTRSTVVVPGADEAAERVYLVELADRRFHLRRVALNKSYNVVDEAGDSTTYLTPTTDGGTAWTWQGMVSDLWAALGLSGSGTLPFTPHGTPQNFTFPGYNAWDALCDVLDRLACVPDYNPLTDTFTIVRLGSQPADETEALSRLGSKVRTWDGDPFDPARATRPEKVRVVFRKHPAPGDGSIPFHTIDKTLPAGSGVVTGSFVTLYDDLTLSDSPSAGELSAADARATERKDDWYRKWQYRDRRLLRVYRDNRGEDAAKVVGGSATSVVWEDRGDGLRVELVSGPDDTLERWRPGSLPVVASPPPPPPPPAECGTPMPMDKAAFKLMGPTAFLLILTGKWGRCACIDLDQAPSLADAAVVGGVPFYLCYSATSDNWRGIKRLRGCCENSTSTITLDFTTNWAVQGNAQNEVVAVLSVTSPCDGSTTTMYFRIGPCMNGKIPLVGGGTALCPTAPADEDCNNEFAGTLECVDPPNDFGNTCECGLCTKCCTTGQAPLNWEATGQFTGEFSEFAQLLLSHDAGCSWSSDDPIATLGWIPEDGKVIYQAAGHTWEIADSEWSCCGANTLTWVGEGAPPEGIPASVAVDPILCGDCDPEAECAAPADRYICATVTAATGAWTTHIGNSILLKWDPVHGQGNLGDVWSNDYSGGPDAFGWLCTPGVGFPNAKILVACLVNPSGYPPGRYWVLQWFDGLDPPQVLALIPASTCAGELGSFNCIPEPNIPDECYTAPGTFVVTIYMLDSAGAACPPAEEAAAAGVRPARRLRSRSAPVAGPGTELRKLLKALGVSDNGCAGCGGTASQMNVWGVDGCRARRDEIAGRLREQAGKRGWRVLLTAAFAAVASGLALRLNPIDPFPGLVDEAIRRAEAQRDSSANTVV